MKQRLTYSGITDTGTLANKFYEVSTRKNTLTTTFGRIGTNGQTKTKDFSTPVEAKNAANKLVEEKLRKGYQTEIF